MSVQQLTLPLDTYPLRNNDRRARLYFQMHRLAAAEDRALTAVEDEENEEWEAAEAELDRITHRALKFYQEQILPRYRSWWL